MRYTVIFILFFSVFAFARRSPKLFPANHGSVTEENRYADAAGIARFKNAAEVTAAVNSGRLVSVSSLCARKLPQWRRYLRPAAAEFLASLDTRYYDYSGHVLTVSSAVRPEEVQRHLVRRNRNAAPAKGERASSHERGTTFDISRRGIKKRDYRWLLAQLLYYRAIGKIHVIEERACLHVMVREDDSRPLEVVSVAVNEFMAPELAPKLDAGTGTDPTGLQPRSATAGALCQGHSEAEPAHPTHPPMQAVLGRN